MAIDSRIQRMVDGDEDAIIHGMISKSVVFRVNGIIQATVHQLRSKAIETQLLRLAGDDTCIFGHNTGYKVSDFAVAALHLLGSSPYTGEDITICKLIGSGLDFT